MLHVHVAADRTDASAEANLQGSLLNPDFNASRPVLLALKQMTLEISEEEHIRPSLSALSPLSTFVLIKSLK